MKTTTIALIAASIALAGCATPPAQVRTVYVPEPASMRADRNQHCRLSLMKADALSTIVLTEIKSCERTKSMASEGCQRMFAALQIAKNDGVLNAANECLDEMNTGGMTVAVLEAFGARAGEISRRLKAMDL